MVRLVGKHLFPKATRSQRKKYARGAIYWFFAGVVIIAMIVALEWLMYQRTLH